jgi:O-antigen ligase/cytochrome c-type biogenesis protein CcmH/NrfG
MSAALRAFFVVAVVAVATLGEGGATATSLLVQHLVLAAACVTFAAALPGAGYAPSRGPSAAWLAFAVLAAAGAMVAPYAYAAWLVLVEIVAFGTLVWLASGDPPALLRVLPSAVALLAAAHGLAAIVQKLSGSPRPASTFLNPNHLAAWLAGAALLLAGSISSRNAPSRVRALHGVAAALALAGIFVTGSRGAALGLAAGASMLVGVTWGGLPTKARRVMLAAAAMIVLAAAAGVAARFRGDDDPYRFHRTRIWAASFGAAAQSPLFGTGPGQFASAAPNLNFPLENTPLRFERSFTTPHSDVLRAVCEFGFPAAFAALAAVVLGARELFRRRGELSDGERGALAALGCWAVQACVDDLTSRPAITLTGAVLVGVLVARRRPESAAPLARTTSAAVAVLVVLTLGVGEIAGFASWNAARSLPRGRLDTERLESLRRSLAWNPMQADGWRRLAEHFMGDGRTWQAADYAAAREAAEHARRLQPADAYVVRAAARVEATASLTTLPFQATRERAAQLYDGAHVLARTDATIPLEAARFLLQAGDAAGSRREAAQALDVEPKAATPRLALAQAILRQEGAAGIAQARSLLDEALALAPRAGEIPSSSYDAALRVLDPRTVEALRRDLEGPAAP